MRQAPEVRILVDEIKGDELAIIQTIEKYRVGERDQNYIIDKIEKIERNTIKLVKLNEEYEDWYRRKSYDQNFG